MLFKVIREYSSYVICFKFNFTTLNLVEFLITYSRLSPPTKN